MSKFAKAGSITAEGPKPPRKGLVVDIDNAKLAVHGQKSSRISDQKLTKGSAKKAGKAAKPAKASKAAKGKGKVERASGLDEKTIKVLKKDHGARPGTNRAQKWDALVSSKTVAQAREKCKILDAGSINAAVEAGVIKLQ